MFATRASRFALAMTMALVFACDSNGPVSNEGRVDESLLLSVSPRVLSVPVGTTGSVTAVVTRGAALVDPIQLSASGVPAGVTVAFAPEVLSGDVVEAKIIVAIADTALPGNHAITVRATATAAIVVSHNFTLAVTPPNPTAPTLGLTFDPAALTVVAGGPSTTSTLNIERVNFTGPVACWADAGSIFLPNDLDVRLSADAVETATSITMTVQAPGTMVPGVYQAGAFCWASDQGSPASGETMMVTVIAAP